MITYSGVKKVNEIMCQELSNREYRHFKATLQDPGKTPPKVTNLMAHG